MLLTAQWLAEKTKGRGCYERTTARPSSKQTVGGTQINAHSPIFKTKKKFSI